MSVRSRPSRRLVRRWRWVALVALASTAVSLVVGAPSARALATAEQALLPSYFDFANLSSLQLNSHVAVPRPNPVATDQGPALRMLDGQFGMAESAFAKQRVQLKSPTAGALSFSTRFSFRITGGAGLAFGADGLTFAIVPSPYSLGGVGGGVGYYGIRKSVAVEYDTWANGDFGDPGENNVEITTNGNFDGSRAVVVPPGGDALEDGRVWTSWVDYDAVSQRLAVRLSADGIRPAAPLIERDIDVLSELGSDGAYFGFTSSSGSSTETIDVFSWISGDAVPPPVAVAGGPATVAEGATVNLSGTASTPGVPGDPITYSWRQLSGPTALLTAPGTATPSFRASNDGTYRFELTVREGEQSATSQVSVTATNVAPSITATARGTADDNVALVDVSYTDAGIYDVHHALVDWGDGSAVESVDSPSQGSGWGSIRAAHRYPTAGAKTATISVVDDAGGQSNTVTQTIDAGGAGPAWSGAGTQATVPAAWANTATKVDAIRVNALGATVTGLTHSNNGITLLAKNGRFTGTTEYVGTLTNTATGTVFSPPPTHLTATSGFPVNYPIADYRPGGRAAVASGAAFHNLSSTCRTYPDSAGVLTARPAGVLPAGLYYATCRIEVTHANYPTTGGLTFVSESMVWLTGVSTPSRVLAPYVDGLGLYAGSAVTTSSVVRIGGTDLNVTGVVVAPSGRVEIGGTRTKMACGVMADTVVMSGSAPTVSSCTVTIGGTGQVVPNPVYVTAPSLLVPKLQAQVTPTPADAAPGQTVQLDGTVTNTGATFISAGLIGGKNIAASAAVTATGATYVLEYFDLASSTWKPLATSGGATPNATLVLVPVASAGTTYPADGDRVTGTTVNAGATASWLATAKVELPALQVAFLNDPTKVSALRTSVTISTSTPANLVQFSRFDENPLNVVQTQHGAVSNAVVALDLPTGTSTTFTSGTTPGLASIAAGASVALSASYVIPLVGAKGQHETTAAYLARLGRLDKGALTAVVSASATAAIGTVYAPVVVGVTRQHLPVVTTTITGPDVVATGETGHWTVTLANSGSGDASALQYEAAVSPATPVALSGLPATLAAGATATSTFDHPIPESQLHQTLSVFVDGRWSSPSLPALPYGTTIAGTTTTVRHRSPHPTIHVAFDTPGPYLVDAPAAYTVTVEDALGQPIEGVNFHVEGGPNNGYSYGITGQDGTSHLSWNSPVPGVFTLVAQAFAENAPISGTTNAVFVTTARPVTIEGTRGRFYPAVPDSPSFAATPEQPAAVDLPFPNIAFNPSPGLITGATVTPQTRPVTDVVVDGTSTQTGTVPAQERGTAIGTGAYTSFDGALQGDFLVTTPAVVTFTLHAQGSFWLGVGDQATRVDGPTGSAPPTTPMAGLPMVASADAPDSAVHDYPITLRFNGTGTYHFELDWHHADAGDPSLVLSTVRYHPPSYDPFDVSFGYVDGPVGSPGHPSPWAGDPDVIFLGDPAATDAGAILLTNTQSFPVELSGLHASTLHPETYEETEQWDIWSDLLPVSVPPGGKVVLTQTAPDNFHTSGAPTHTCVAAPDHLMLRYDTDVYGEFGSTYYAFDTDQITTTGGVDHVACPPVDVVHDWENPADIPIPGVVPSPIQITITPAEQTAVVDHAVTVIAVAHDLDGHVLVGADASIRASGAQPASFAGPTEIDGGIRLTYADGLAGDDLIQATIAGVGSPVATIHWIDPAKAPPGPVVTNVTPVESSILYQPVNVTATITAAPGTTITSWSVSARHGEDADSVPVGSGTGTPPAQLGFFDTTGLPDGAWIIDVDAVDDHGGFGTNQAIVTVAGQMKLGRYRVGYTDLTTPVGSATLELKRTYDSLDRDTVGSFGNGWNLDLANFKVSTATAIGNGGWIPRVCGLSGWLMAKYCWSSVRNHDVTVTWPDGHAEIFRPQLHPTFDIALCGTPCLIGRFTELSYAPIKGTSTLTSEPTYSTNEPPDNAVFWNELTQSMQDPSAFWSSGYGDPNYTQKSWTLTDKYGNRYRLGATGGLQQVTEADGNVTTIDHDGIHTSRGLDFTFHYDDRNRISRIDGPSHLSATYEYDARGDLRRVADAYEGEVTQFDQLDYDYAPGHLLRRVPDIGNQTAKTLTFDAQGHLTAETDQLGRPTNVTVEPTACTPQAMTIAPSGCTTVLQEPDNRTVKWTYDPLGRIPTFDRYFPDLDSPSHLTTITYNDEDSILTMTDPSGKVTTFSYDQHQNPTGASDEAGSTSSTYNSHSQVTTSTDQLGRTTSYTYDTNTRLTAITNPLGQTRNFTYDSHGELTSETDTAGHLTTYTLDAQGRRLSRTDPLGHTWTNRFDWMGNIDQVTDPDGGSTVTQYDGERRVTAVSDSDDVFTGYAYNSRGDLIGQYNQNGTVNEQQLDAVGNPLLETDGTRSVARTYDGHGNVLTETDLALGGTTHYGYDSGGRLTSITDPVGLVTSYGYDRADRKRFETTPASGTTTFDHDDDGRVTIETDALGQATSRTYDAAGNVLSTTDANGTTVTFEYDALNRETKTTTPTGSTTTVYDAAGNVAQSTDRTGATTYQTYDAANRRLSVTDPNGHTTTFAYTAGGRLQTITDANNAVILNTFTPGGRVATTTSAAGTQATYTYDHAGNVASITTPAGTVSSTYAADGSVLTRTDARGMVSSTTYVVPGLPATQSQVGTDGGSSSVSFHYDAAGRRTGVVDANGHERTSAYDPATGRLAADVKPGGAVTSYAYDQIGELTTITDPRGLDITLGHDGLGNVVTEDREEPTGGTTHVVYGFDADDRLTSISQPNRSATFGYDNEGRLTSSSTPEGSLSYTYDAAGNRSTMTTPQGVTSYVYDPTDLLSSMTTPAGTYTVSRRADGRVTSMTRPGGITTGYTYDAADRVTGIHHATGGGQVLADYTYDLDPNGNPTSAALSDPSGTRTETYGLDGQERLRTVDDGAQTSAAIDYDPAGNRTSEAVTTPSGTTTTAYTYDVDGQLTTIDNGSGTRSFTYDPTGNQVTDGAGNTFTWDRMNNLTSISGTAGSHTFTYDPSGLRVTSDGSSQLWDPTTTSLVRSGTDTFTDLPGMGTVASSDGGGLHQLLSDRLGSVRAMTDGGGTVQGAAAYDVTGTVRASSGAPLPLGFTGAQAAPAGLVYLQHRYLQSAVGRFLSVDTLQPNAMGPTGWNTYAYSARPTSVTDPTGHAELVSDAIIRPIWQRMMFTALEALAQVTLEQVLMAALIAASGRAVWLVSPQLAKLINGLMTRGLTAAVATTVAALCASRAFQKTLTGTGTTCTNTSIFIPGIDTPDTTANDINGLRKEPAWVRLTRATHPATTSWRGWYRSDPICQKRSSAILQVCDEFPFYSTSEGGPGAPGHPRAELMLTPRWEGYVQGGKLSAFYRLCGVQPPTNFLVMPSLATPGVWACY